MTIPIQIQIPNNNDIDAWDQRFQENYLVKMLKSTNFFTDDISSHWSFEEYEWSMIFYDGYGYGYGYDYDMGM